MVFSLISCAVSCICVVIILIVVFDSLFFSHFLVFFSDLTSQVNELFTIFLFYQQMCVFFLTKGGQSCSLIARFC